MACIGDDEVMGVLRMVCFRRRKCQHAILILVPVSLLITYIYFVNDDSIAHIQHLQRQALRAAGLRFQSDVSSMSGEENARGRPKQVPGVGENEKAVDIPRGRDRFMPAPSYRDGLTDRLTHDEQHKLRIHTVKKGVEGLKQEEKPASEGYESQGGGQNPGEGGGHGPQLSGTCDSGKCNPTKDGMLNIHIVAHSHDDVGWKKTYMQYFNGKSGDFGETGYHGGECTRCILNSVIPQLLKDPRRRFIFVEMAFLSLWYQEQDKQMQEDVRKLIRERRLELIIGGWCMSDSATTYYDDVIDQHTYGFQWIERQFGECAMPRSAWHVDQFGHSREHSSLFAQFGFDGLLVGRIDVFDHERRTRTRNMETIWKTSPDNLGDKTDLFTSVLYDGYFTPGTYHGVMDARSRNTTMERFIAMATERAKGFKTNHVLIPFGGDFDFSSASVHYDVIDNLIKHINAQQNNGGKVNVLYSTPTCYINSVNREAATFETISTDFFPYGIIPNTYWTGFFTSRPGLKRHVKTASSLLQTCKMLAVFAELKDSERGVDDLKEAVAILQHHDAITGTEQQHVTNDYNLILSAGEQSCQSVVSRAYQSLLGVSSTLHFCPLLNISVCGLTESNTEFTVQVFNPLGWNVTHWVRLPVPVAVYTVLSLAAGNLQNQLVPIADSTKHIPERGSSVSVAELVFKAELPPLGYSVFYVLKASDLNLQPQIVDHADQGDITIGNQYLSLVVSGSSGLTQTLKNVAAGVTIDFAQSFLYYIGSEGGYRIPGDRRGGMGGFFGGHKRASGAYAFVPKENTPPVKLMGRDGKVKVKVVKGTNVQEIHQEFSPWVSQVVRLYDGAPYLELEWTVGPIPESDRQTKEVISRIQTNLQTKNTFYTDSNGREMITRILNVREPSPFNVTCPISGNYYPVTGRIFIKDDEKNVQLTVLTDRSQAGASLQNGQMELMVHRRTFKDDDLGVEEPLDEKGVDGKGLIIRGKHYVVLNSVERAAEDYRHLGLRVHHFPTMSFMSGVDIKGIKTKTSWLKRSLPDNVHLLTLDRIHGDPNMLLLRLENCFETKERSQTAELALHDYIEGIKSVRERSLGGNHNVTGVKRLRWKTMDGITTPDQISDAVTDVLLHPYIISLKPMEIRTFHIHIERSVAT
ncbi:lysosomal alpha-mannosidase-like isoform X2 [Haliotis rufescens]|uniref:lysosomal alpha-mannosidase-like isoform X2 n=1 Tax=Haliotis rufescens TaxID=6454 RepID=UPI00201FAC31|nr:lysosomal alpha-mannosidase-like isoform X2 [Haliotis rufescens]